MFRKISLKARLTIITICILTVASLAITAIANYMVESLFVTDPVTDIFNDAGLVAEEISYDQDSATDQDETGDTEYDDDSSVEMESADIAGEEWADSADSEEFFIEGKKERIDSEEMDYEETSENGTYATYGTYKYNAAIAVDANSEPYIIISQEPPIQGTFGTAFYLDDYEGYFYTNISDFENEDFSTIIQQLQVVEYVQTLDNQPIIVGDDFEITIDIMDEGIQEDTAVAATEVAEDDAPLTKATMEIDGVIVETYTIPYSVFSTERGQSFTYITYLFMGLVIVAASVLTYILSAQMLKPVVNLSKEMQEIDEHNLNHRIDGFLANDEVSRLSASFNSMLAKLEQAFLSQKRFTANAAHELRTPLTVMQTNIDVFRKNNMPENTDYEELVELLDRYCGRLTDLVENLMLMSKNQDMDIVEAIDLNDCLDMAVIELEDEAEKRHIIIEKEDVDAIVYGNPILINRLFFNILQNAVKYNVDGGKIRVECELGEEKHTIRISDTGIGMKPEETAAVFEPFYRVDTSRSRETGGVGLGLSIVKSILDKHRGSIAVESEEGKGTTFIVTLPGKV